MIKKDYIIKNGVIISPFKTIKDRNLVIEGGKITKLLNKDINFINENNYEIIDLKNEHFISPGLIDIHTHGGGGEDCIDGNLEIISKCKLNQGITGYLPTLIASPISMIFSAFDRINTFIKDKKNKNLPRILGTHIEGIYLSHKYRGAQGLEFLRKPDPSECKEIINNSHGLLKIMTLSPELENCIDVIELLSSKGIVSSLGHSDAKPDDIAKAINKGATHITHAFNAMGEMSHKEPGVRSSGFESYILIRDELKLEVIGELTHVDPNIMEMIFRCKGDENIILVTDSLSVSGLPAGKYNIGVTKLNLADENPYVARLEDGGLAGSTIPMIKAVQNFYENTSATLNQAIRMASYNPLHSLGLTSKKGSIEIGKDADLITFNKDFAIRDVFIEGKKVL